MGLIFSESFQDNFKEREFSRKEKLISESYGNCTLMSHYLYTKSYVFKTIKYSRRHCKKIICIPLRRKKLNTNCQTKMLSNYQKFNKIPLTFKKIELILGETGP